MTSLFDQAIADGCNRAFAKATAPDGWLTKQIRKHVRWHMQGYADGFTMKHREAFTQTVADRIHEKARRRLRIFGVPLWLVREPREWCEQEAEEMVVRFLDDERIRFGDHRYWWENGHEIADAEMEYWEAA